MHILQLTNKPPYPANDGGTIATLNLSLGFSHFQNRVDILAISTKKHFLDTDNHQPENIPGNIRISCVFVNTEIDPFKALSNLLFSKLPYIAVRFYSKNYIKKLIQLISENKYNIIQIEGLYMCQYIPVIRKYSNAKISFRSHNIEHEIWQRIATNEKNRVKRIYLKILANRIKNMELSALNQYDMIVPIT